MFGIQQAFIQIWLQCKDFIAFSYEIETINSPIKLQSLCDLQRNFAESLSLPVLIGWGAEH